MRVPTIAKRFTFDAAHRLERLPADHKCHRLHGHTYTVELVLAGPVDPETGFVVDYDAMARAWHEGAASRLDHHYLNEVPGLEIPSTENLVAWIARELARRPELRGPIDDDGAPTTLLIAVRVFESSTTWCEMNLDAEDVGICPWLWSMGAMRSVVRRNENYERVLDERKPSDSKPS